VEKSPARARLALLWAAFAGAALLLFAPALGGEFIGDDWGYIVNNGYVHDLDAAGTLALFDPFGDAALFTANWAPVHQLATAGLLAAFGPDPVAWHVPNVLLHALVSTLLAAVFARSGIPRGGAVALAAVFLVHPANVESVAWAFQQKTILALGFALGALLAFPRRPLLSVALLTLGLLSKFSACFALPVAAAQAHARRAGRREWVWLGVLAAVVALAGLPEFAAFDRIGHATVFSPWADAGEQARSIVAIAARYLALAFTGLGASTNHEPAVARSFADPWFLFGAVALAALGLRTLSRLRARSEEAAYWLWAAAAWLPISQVFPFLYPMADRYLYFILPGLLGGAWFAGADALRALGRRLAPAARAPLERRLGSVGLVAGGAVVLAFAALAVPRARAFRSELHFALDAAKHYPDGRAAQLLRARRAAAEGDAPAAIAGLERLAERGFDQFLMLRDDPAFARLAGSPAFRAAQQRIAGNWIRVASARRRHVQQELRTLALAYQTLGDLETAAQTYERALAQGGPIDAVVRQELAALRREARP
jgi:tetratricopeptide (TPR) repeat protein